MSPPSASRSEPNFTLDPQGFRGTETERRTRQSRQRRRLRTLAFSLLLLAGAAVAGWFWSQPRAQGFDVADARTLPLDLNAPATVDNNGNLWISSASGALWRVNSNGKSERYGVATGAGAPPLVSASGGIYVPGMDGTLTAFTAPGRAKWTRELGAALATTPQLWRDGDTPILAVGDGDGKVSALSASDGKTLWSAQLGGPIGDGIAATADGFLVPTLANGIWRGGLIALDGKTGRVRWKFPSDGKLAAGVAASLFDAQNNRVYWNNDEGVVASLDATSGRVFWQTEVALAIAPQSVMLRAQPVISGQSVIVGGSDGLLRSLDAGNGKARWKTDLGSPIRSLSVGQFAGRPAIVAVTQRELILADASQGKLIQRDAATAAWLLSGGRSAIIAGEGGKWRQVSW